MSRQLHLLAMVTLLAIVNVCTACTPENENSYQIRNEANEVNNQSCAQDCCSSLSSRNPMTYFFYQNTGHFIGGTGQWRINTLGYSGFGDKELKPQFQCTPKGPLPSSTYTLAFCKNVMHESTNRPCSFYLRPDKPEQVCGRDDFFIHGCHCCSPDDDTQPPFPGCSQGCVVIDYKDRKKLRVGDKLIVLHYQNIESRQQIQE